MTCIRVYSNQLLAIMHAHVYKCCNGRVRCLKMYMYMKEYHTVRILSPASETNVNKKYRKQIVRTQIFEHPEFGNPEIKRDTHY